ncbi:uncharacterized protein LOC108743583 [Agrilus planipennis]|uniref:Uncharacterized protein LOC108743583 n=1 Tax=Agrilus planipennis TaxID=224129 RepID=A0A1W4XF86_AGRPL|nr:uncharacterized protein LOC108743583 [Agrilus planipennis]
MAYHFIFLLVSICGYVSSFPQSNYADQANNVEYIGKGLPEQATLDGKVTQLDDLSPIITLNRTKAALNCAAGSMQVELKFNDKFYGIAYADFDRNSACQVSGKGAYSYELELPLKGCGTKQGPQRVFTNNIVVRFHPGLEMDGDEIITIVCRYPPPVAPLPSPVTNRIFVPPAAPLEPPLSGFHILLIICGILFLSLLLLGLGCSYYCLRRRTIPAVYRSPPSVLETDSEITKLSESSVGKLLTIGGVKIPPARVSAASGSDTLPSDYPSESHSEVEDVETRSLPISSAGSYENRAYVQDTSSFYSEHYGHTQEQTIKNAVATPATVERLPMPIKEGPKFDVQVRVKKVPPPSPPSISESDTSRNLSTIMEQREESLRSVQSHPVERTHFTYVPELHPPPKHIQPAPTFNRILRRQQQEIAEEIETPSKSPPRALVSLDTELMDTRSVTEVFDETQHKFVAPVPPPPPPIVPKQHLIKDEAPPPELPIQKAHKPEVTSHLVDDVYLRTITEKKRIEDIERHKRYVTEYHTRPKPIEDQKWDVTIRNYPVEMPEPPDWENFSDISSASNLTLTPKMERAPLSLPPQPQIDDDKLPLTAPEIVGNIAAYPPRRFASTREEVTRESYLETFNIPPENPQVPNWNVLIRVLQPQDEEGPVLETAEQFNSQLTMADKMKWRQIITTESTLRTLLTEATVREDFERIRSDRRYETLFEPPKWDIIIRILTPSDKKGKGHYRKKSDWDNRSRRSSLPTLYEYDSDGGSSVKTLTNESAVRPQIPLRLRKSSRSSYRSEADLRSMSEMTVDFARPDHGDSQSEVSSYYPGPGRYYDDSETDTEYKPSSTQHPSLTRSLSQPSLARSASEFTERWVAPSRYDTASEYTTPEGTPRSQRSTRIQPVHVPRSGVEQSSVWEQSSSAQVAQAPGGARIVAQQYRSEMSASYQQSGRRNWFGDNDSEASFK